MGEAVLAVLVIPLLPMAMIKLQPDGMAPKTALEKMSRSFVLLVQTCPLPRSRLQRFEYLLAADGIKETELLTVKR